jgi:hypothetical protein
LSMCSITWQAYSQYMPLDPLQNAALENIDNSGCHRLDTKDTCCTLPLYDSGTVNTNRSEEIQV